MSVRVVCVSRTLGSLGEEIAELVSKRLGFRYIDREIVVRAAEREDLEPGLIEDVERRRSFIERLLDSLDRTAVLESAAFNPTLRSPAEYTTALAQELNDPAHRRELVRESIREFGNRGNVVIVAHAASMALEGLEGLLRVLITASPETRARRVAESGGMEEREAQRAVRRSDGNRAEYFKNFYGLREEQSTQYDLVINTDVLAAEAAADLIVRAAQALPA